MNAAQRRRGRRRVVSRERSENRRIINPSPRCNKRKRDRVIPIIVRTPLPLNRYTLDDAWRRAAPDQRETIEFHVCGRQTDSRRHPMKRGRRRRKPREENRTNSSIPRRGQRFSFSKNLLKISDRRKKTASCSSVISNAFARNYRSYGSV